MQRRITALGAAFAMSLLFAGPLSGQPPAGRAPHNLINPAKAWADGQGASLSAPSDETLTPSEEPSQPETPDASPPARPELDRAGFSREQCARGVGSLDQNPPAPFPAGGREVPCARLTGRG